MREFAKPTVVVSRCLGFDAVRYDGSIVNDEFVAALKPHVKFIPVCPEVEIGLGVPRETVRVVEAGGKRRLVQPATGADLTAKMETFAASFLDVLGPVDGFILKSRSPSSGIKDVKIYPAAEGAAPSGKGAGFFGGAALERFGRLAFEDEGRLKNARLREHFLTKLFALASFRELREKGKAKDVVAFHAANKFLLMAYNQTRMRELGRVVAAAGRGPLSETLAAYEDGFTAALARPPRYQSNVNVLTHGLGYFKDKLGREEKAFFLDALERFRAKRVPLSVPLNVLRGYVVRFGEGYLENQTFFSPYPEDLTSLADSGKGRE
ncbi:MAG: DUF523 and DUF1722 domain-containing protein [Candidatus Zixiibacteriota bacterium]|jgi:uncharacterized protein YbgA (DUF1722 family)/uncharacterized protein YbbK (DUF523 family)